MMLPKLKIAVALLATVLLATGAVIARNSSGNDPASSPVVENAPPKKNVADEKKPDPRPIVRLVLPKAGGIDHTSNQSGRAEAVQQADLHPGVRGAIKTLNADIGDPVKKGQLLAEIEAPELILDERLAATQVEQAMSLKREAQAGVATAKTEMLAAEATVRLRESDARAARATFDYRRKQLERMRALVENKAIDQKIFDEAESAYLSAQNQADGAAATVDSAKAELKVKGGKLVQGEIAVQTAITNVGAAQLSLEKARLALARTRIIAPFDGIVARRNLSVGDFVRPDQTAANHSELFTIVRVDLIRVVVQIPESQISLVKPGMAVDVYFQAVPKSRFPAKVSRIGYVVDPKVAAMRAEIDIMNSDGNLRPGMSGRVSLILQKASPLAFRLPITSTLELTKIGDGKINTSIYVYRDGKAHRVQVQCGATDGKEIEVLTGLTAEDRVVANPNKLTPGDDVPVQIETPDLPKK